MDHLQCQAGAAGNALEDEDTYRRFRFLVFSLAFLAIFILLLLTTTGKSSAVSVYVKVQQVEAVDSIEGFLEGDPDWYYYVGYDAQGWVWTDPQGLYVGTNVVIGDTWSYSGLNDADLFISIGFCEADSLSADDMADITSYDGLGPGSTSGGYDDVPTSYCGWDVSGKPQSAMYFYLGFYNIVTDQLTGDSWSWNGGYRLTSGTSDGNPGDENDANVWFDVWDDYVPVGCGGTVLPLSGTEGTTVFNFNGYATDGLSPFTYLWDFDDGSTSTSAVTTHVYSNFGSYWPTFTVQDAAGQSEQCIVTQSRDVGHAAAASVILNPSGSVTRIEGQGVSAAATVVDLYFHDITSFASITWSVVSGPCTIDLSSGPSTNLNTPSSGGGTSCTLRVTGSYNGGSPTADLNVIIEHSDAFVVSLTPSSTQTIPEGGSLPVSALVRDTNNHDITSLASISWSIVSGPCTVSAGSGSSTNLQVGVAGGGQTCILRASATYRGTASSDLTVNIAHAGPISVAVSPSPAAVPEGGTQVFTATVTDVGGHDVSASSSFTWSVAPTSCGSLSPAGSSATFTASSTAGGASCTITASASFTTTSTWSDSGSASATVAHAGPITVAVAPPSPTVPEGGTQVFTAAVTDAGGHDVTASATITWSVTPPSCGSISPPSGGSTTLTASPAAGGLTCSVTASAMLTTTSTWTDDDSASVDILDLPNPDYAVSATPPIRTAQSGTSTDFSVTVTQQNGYSGPDVAVALWNPPSGFTATCAPPNVTPTGTCTLTVNIAASVAPGLHQLTVRGSNGTSNRDTIVSVEIPLDSCTLSPPSATIQVGTSQQFTAHAWAGGTEILFFTTTWSAIGAGTIDQLGMFVASTAEGTAVVTANVTVGGSSVICSADVTVTLTPPPTVVITNPSDGSIVSGIVAISGSALNADRVEVRIDGQDWVQAAGVTSWTSNWDTSGVGGGNHTIEARSLSGNLSSSVASIRVEVRNNRPPNVTRECGGAVARALVGQLFACSPQAEDEDGDTLVWSLEDAPSWLTIDPSTGFLAGTPPSADTWIVKVRVIDGQGGSDEFVFAIEATSGLSPGQTDLLPWILVAVLLVLFLMVLFLLKRRRQSNRMLGTQLEDRLKPIDVLSPWAVSMLPEEGVQRHPGVDTDLQDTIRLRIMSVLKENPSNEYFMRRTDLADGSLNIDKTALSRILTYFKLEGFIRLERDTDDQRADLIYAGPRYHEWWEALSEGHGGPQI